MKTKFLNYFINVSNSSTKLSNNCKASSTGFFVDISTPASLKIETGSLDHPALRKFSLYALTAGAPSFKIFCESAIAAEKPVAYWYT